MGVLGGRTLVSWGHLAIEVYLIHIDAAAHHRSRGQNTDLDQPPNSTPDRPCVHADLIGERLLARIGVRQSRRDIDQHQLLDRGQAQLSVIADRAHDLARALSHFRPPQAL